MTGSVGLPGTGQATITTASGRIICRGDAPAVGRFRPEGIIGFRAASDPNRRIWPTRIAAMVEEGRIRESIRGSVAE